MTKLHNNTAWHRRARFQLQPNVRNVLVRQSLAAANDVCGLPTVFEMSQQSNFRNRAVVEKGGVRYRPNRHGDPRDTTRPSLAPASLSGLFPCWPLLAALQPKAIAWLVLAP